MPALHLEIITPDRTAYEGEVTAVTLPTADGEITVLARHVPLVSAIVPGTLQIHAKDGIHYLAVSRGVVEVDGKNVRVLTQSADLAEELEEAAIEQAKTAAEKLMAEKRGDSEGFAEATAILERELARLKVVRRHRGVRRTLPQQEG